MLTARHQSEDATGNAAGANVVRCGVMGAMSCVYFSTVGCGAVRCGAVRCGVGAGVGAGVDASVWRGIERHDPNMVRPMSLTNHTHPPLRIVVRTNRRSHHTIAIAIGTAAAAAETDAAAAAAADAAADADAFDSLSSAVSRTPAQPVVCGHSHP